jgi:shikimate kinase
MGSGKSTLGRALSRATGIGFIDLDSYIENRYHKSISDIFATGGEAAFRDIERKMLSEVADFEDIIVACGGGTPCFNGNMELMNSRGTTVFLDTPVDTLHRRLCRARHKRPLIAAMDDGTLRRYIVTALESRLPSYSRAKATFASGQLDNASQIAESTAQFIDRFIKPGQP